MGQSELSPQAHEKAYPRVAVVMGSEPPGERQVYLILGDKHGFLLGSPRLATQKAESKVQLKQLTDQQFEVFKELFPGAIEEADRMDAERAAAHKVRQTSDRQSVPRKKSKTLTLAQLLGFEQCGSAKPT